MIVNHLKTTFLSICTILIGSSAHGWERYGGDGARQFTELDQINHENIDRLGEAWVFRTGDLNQDFARKGHSFQATPIFWNDMLYISTSANWVIAVNAATGEEIWRFDPELPKDIGYSESASRGVSIWHGDSAICPSRVFIGTLIGEMHALDAVTGLPCDDFGDKGTVDLSKGVGEVDIGDYSITSPPAVIGDQIIVGSAIGDNRAVQSERGIVRAMDARSGKIRWIWDPIPRSEADPAWQTWEGESAAITYTRVKGKSIAGQHGSNDGACRCSGHHRKRVGASPGQHASDGGDDADLICRAGATAAQNQRNPAFFVSGHINNGEGRKRNIVLQQTGL